MASPTEYRDALWKALYEGDMPKSSKDSSGRGMTVSSSDVDAMNAMFAQAKALRGETDDLDS